MRVTLRASLVTLSALLLAAVIVTVAAVPSLFTVVALASTTVLIMGGTGHPSSAADTVDYVKQYMGMAVGNYVSPSSTTTDIPEGPYNGVAVITPEEHAPNYGTLTLRESVTQGLAALDSCLIPARATPKPNLGSRRHLTLWW